MDRRKFLKTSVGGALINSAPSLLSAIRLLPPSVPPHGRGYVVNVASARNGWTHIDGWSEAVVDYLRSLEGEANADH